MEKKDKYKELLMEWQKKIEYLIKKNKVAIYSATIGLFLAFFETLVKPIEVFSFSMFLGGFFFFIVIISTSSYLIKDAKEEKPDHKIEKYFGLVFLLCFIYFLANYPSSNCDDSRANCSDFYPGL